MRPWMTGVALCIISAFSRDAAAQTKHAPPSITTKSGVYSREQATRGQDVYAGYCKSCHTPQSHTGPVFNATWNGRNLSDLYTFIRDRMPKNEPGSLSEQEYADVLAYVLRMNLMPSGKTELPSDSTKLSTIRIETTIRIKTTKSSRGSSP